MASVNVAWCGVFVLIDRMSVDIRIDVTNFQIMISAQKGSFPFHQFN